MVHEMSHSRTKYGNTTLTILIVPLTLSPLYLLVRLDRTTLLIDLKLIVEHTDQSVLEVIGSPLRLRLTHKDVDLSLVVRVEVLCDPLVGSRTRFLRKDFWEFSTTQRIV